MRAKQTIFYQGEVPTSLYSIDEGLVRAYVIHENGEEATVALFGAGDFFPVAAAYDILPVTLYYYEAFSDCTLRVHTLTQLQQQIAADYEQEYAKLGKRYVGALLHVSSLAQDSARAKVAHTLRYLAVRFGEKLPDGRHYKISLRLTQQDIAKLCNISRETSSIELTKLKKAMLVRERNKYYVVNLSKLSSEVGEDGLDKLRLS